LAPLRSSLSSSSPTAETPDSRRIQLTAQLHTTAHNSDTTLFPHLHHLPRQTLFCVQRALLSRAPPVHSTCGKLPEGGRFSSWVGVFRLPSPLGDRCFSSLSQGLSLGGGAVVCFPSTNARLLATVCRGGNAVVVVAVVVNGVRSECQVRLLIGYILSIFKHLTHLTIQ